MSVVTFIETHSLFTTEELLSECEGTAYTNGRLLERQVKKGAVMRVGRIAARAAGCVYVSDRGLYEGCQPPVLDVAEALYPGSALSAQTALAWRVLGSCEGHAPVLLVRGGKNTRERVTTWQGRDLVLRGLSSLEPLSCERIGGRVVEPVGASWAMAVRGGTGVVALSESLGLLARTEPSGESLVDAATRARIAPWRLLALADALAVPQRSGDDKRLMRDARREAVARRGEPPAILPAADGDGLVPWERWGCLVPEWFPSAARAAARGAGHAARV